MNTHSGLEQGLAFLNAHLRPATGAPSAQRKLAVTISRQAGAGAWIVGRELATLLDRRAPAGPVKWTVFDRELVEKVLNDHNLPKKLADFMPEDRVSMLDDIVTEILGLHPPSWTLMHATTDTVLKLAELGNVIIIGRGASLITAKLNHVLHVRLVGSLERRIARVAEHLSLDPRAAREFVEKADRGHQRYIREHFKAEIENPLLYDLVINTDRIPCEQAAGLIAETLLTRAGATGG